MDFNKHLKEQLTEDFKLLKELENRRRSEDDPRRKLKLNDDIAEIKQQIFHRQTELNSLPISPVIVSPLQLPTKELEMQRFPNDASIDSNKIMSVQPNQAIEVFYSYAH